MSCVKIMGWIIDDHSPKPVRFNSSFRTKVKDSWIQTVYYFVMSRSYVVIISSFKIDRSKIPSRTYLATVKTTQRQWKIYFFLTQPKIRWTWPDFLFLNIPSLFNNPMTTDFLVHKTKSYEHDCSLYIIKYIYPRLQ